MSDFLNVKDRVPTQANRKKITKSDGSVEYVKIEYADEPIEQGTKLNKALFNKFNAVLGYNELDGSYSATNSLISYTTEQDLSNFENNQIFRAELSELENKIVNNVKLEEPITLEHYTTGHNNTTSYKLSNGNTVVFSTTYSDSTYTTHYLFVDKNGNPVSESKTKDRIISTDVVELDDGRLFVVGTIYGSSYYTSAHYIIGTDFESTALKTSVSSNYICNCLKMSNGNIMMYSQYTSSYPRTYVSIFSQNDETIKSYTSVGAYNAEKIIELDNGNFIGVGSGSNGIQYSIFDKNLNIIKSDTTTSYGSNYAINALKISNGNIVIPFVYHYNAEDRNVFMILNQAGTIIKDMTYIGSVTSMLPAGNGDSIVLPNDKIMIYDGSKVLIFDLDGTIIKNETLDFGAYSVGSSFRSKIIKHLDEAIICFGCDMVNARLFATLLDINGNVLVNPFVVDSAVKISELKLLPYEHGNDFVSIVLQDIKDGADINFVKILYDFVPPTNTDIKINGINVDTFLKEKTRYELIYNETENKFIAYEIHVPEIIPDGAKVVKGAYTPKTSLQTISVGFKPDLVIIQDKSNISSSVSASTGASTFIYIPKIIFRDYNSSTSSDAYLTNGGFRVKDSTASQTLYYIAIKF